MNHRLPLGAAAAFMLAACAPAAFSHAHKVPVATVTAQATADNAAIAQLERRWMADIARGDRRDLATILADDYMDIDWRGHRRDKHALLAALNPAAGTTQRISALRVRTWGDTAVASGINQVHSSAKGWTVEVSFTDVFARIDGRWLAVSSQETLRKSTGP